MADNTVKVKIEGDASGLVAATDTAAGAITGLASKAAGAVGGFTSLAAGAVRELGKIGVAAGTVAATVTSALAFKGLKANAQFEDYNVQFATLIKNSKDFAATYPNLTTEQEKFAKATELANQKMKDLAKFGAETPFELPQVVEAQRVLMGFGLASDDAKQRFGQSGDDILRIAGDVASGTGADFKEIALDMGKFSSGATGEAIMRFQELGIVTRSELEQMGLKFSKNGELIVKNQQEMDKATSILFSAMQKKYGGLMDAQSQTFNGILSNIKDNMGLWMRELSQPIFDPLKQGLNKVYEFMSSDAGNKALKSLKDKIQAGVYEIHDMILSLKEGFKGLTFEDSDGPYRFFHNIGAGIREAMDAVKTFKAALQGEWVSSKGINPFVEKVGEFGLLLRNTIIPELKEFIDKVKPIAEEVLKVASAFSPLMTALDVLKGFLTGGTQGAVDAFKDRLKGMGDYLGIDLVGIFNNVVSFFQTTLIPAFQNIAGFITTTVIPGFQQLADFVVNTIIPAFQQFAQWVGANILPIFESMGNTFVTTILPSFQQLGQFVMTEIVPALQQLATWVGNNVVPVLENLASFIANTVVPVLGSIASFIFDTVIPALTKIGEVIATVVGPVLEGLGNFISTTVLPALKDIGTFIEQNVIPALRNIWQWVDQNVMPVLRTLAEWVGGFLKSAMEGYGQVVNTVWSGIKGTISLAWDTISGIFNTIKTNLQAVGDAFNTLKNGIGTAWDGIKNFISTAWDTINGIFDKIIGVIKGTFQGAWDGLKTAIGTVWDGIKTAATSAWDVLSGVFNKIKDVILDIPNKIKELAQTIWNWISSTAKDALSKAMEIGKGIIDGIVKGIGDGIGSIKDAIGKAVGDPIGFAKNLLGIHSPSTVFAEMGEMIMQGLALGINKEKSTAIEELQKAVTAMADVMTKGSAAFDALKSYGAVNQTVMNQFFSDVNNAMIVFTGVAATFKSDGLKAAGEYADSASKMVGMISAGVTALNSLSEYSAISQDQMNQFMSDLTNTMIVFGQDALNFNKEGLDASNLYADAAGKMVAIIGPAVQGLAALQDYKALARDNMTQFIRDVNEVVSDFVESAGWYEENDLKAASTFAESTGKMLAILGPGVTGLMALANYKQITEDSLLGFIRDVNETVSVFIESSGWFEDKELKAASTFADAAGKVVGIIGNAVQGFTALQNFKGVPPAAIQALVDGISYTVELATIAASKMETDMMVQVGVFGEAVGKLFNGFKAAIDTFAGLEKFKATPSKVIQAFISELEFTVSLAADLAAKADKDMIAETAKFAESVGKIFNGLKSAMDLMKSLETFKGYPADAVKKLMDGIKAAIVAMADTNKQVDTFLIQAEHFADTIAAAVGKINAGLADLKSLSGVSVSANVTVNGGGVPAKALGGLASGLTLWGEAGTEAANVPGRGLVLANSPTLSNFPPGTRVYSAGETKQLTTNMGGIYITVNAAPGMDVYTLAQEVKKAIDNESGQAALYTRLRN